MGKTNAQKAAEKAAQEAAMQNLNNEDLKKHRDETAEAAAAAQAAAEVASAAISQANDAPRHTAAGSSNLTQQAEPIQQAAVHASHPHELSYAEQLAKKQLVLADLQIENALAQQEELAESLAARRAKKTQDRLTTEQRQQTLRKENELRKQTTKSCTHRQGGNPRTSPTKGKGPTALNVVIAPDGFTKLITCSCCRLRKVTPHPYDKSTKAQLLRFAPVYNEEGQRIGSEERRETAREIQIRVDKYHDDLAECEELLKNAEEGALTPESARPMDCGATFSFENADGLPVLLRRPSDFNALQF